MVFIIITIFLIIKILTIITLLDRWYLKQIGFPEQVNQTKVCKHVERRNLRHYNVGRDENLQRKSEINEFLRFSRSFRLQANIGR